MKVSKSKVISLIFVYSLLLVLNSCNDEDTPVLNPLPEPVAEEFDINSITDTYYGMTPDNVYKWGSYNVHDPSIIKVADTYYCYSTDACFGADIKAGHQIRKSTDLIEWKFVGWVFNNLPSQGAAFIRSKGTEPFNSLWAPFVMEVDGVFRLYYSLSSSVGRLSVIGMATATNPSGPWTEQGIVVTSQADNSVQTNAIDPTVVVSPAGEHWFFYGSAWDGIYKIKLNPTTGLAETPGDKGVRVANRGFTSNTINGNIEGPEVIYNSEFQKYYLFISYDWLQTKYNVRVGRSDNPDGPYYDFHGNDMNVKQDNAPMILAPYKFNGHSGWQGVAHQCVFNDGKGQYFIGHQGRPGENSYFMDLHIRKMHWTPDGWPIVSPERFANVEQTAITSADLVGTYEQIVFGYTVVPGFADEQTSADFQTSVNLTLEAGGSINNDAANSWTFSAPWLTLNWANGFTDKVYVERERDWEKKIASTIVFTGLNNDGTTIWGKKIQ